MTTCKDCLQAALNWTWGGYQASCDACNTRGIAVSPRFVREHYYQRILADSGPAALAEAKRAVSAEWGRIQRLKDRQQEDSNAN